MQRVSTQELKKMLEEKGIKLNCEDCGHNDFVLLTNFASLILQDSDTVGLASYPVVALECENCGSIKMFGRKRLRIADD